MSEKNEPLYFPNLDGLRAIAAFAVILFHCPMYFTFPDAEIFKAIAVIISFGGNGGNMGVEFFFVLSGFLITYLMFAEQTKKGSVNIVYFYARRVLRIWPLHYITIVAGFVVYPIVMHLAGLEFTQSASAFMYIIFAANFDHIYGSPPNTGILGVQWTVAIEEQFYLAWPLLFNLFRRNAFPYFLIISIMMSEYFYYSNISSPAIYHYHTLANYRFLAFGSLLAYLCYKHIGLVQSFLNRINRPITLFVYLACLLLLFFQWKLLGAFPLSHYLFHFLPFFFFGFVIIEQNFSVHSLFKIGGIKFLRWPGKISYGLYLTHMIAIYIVIGVFPSTQEYFIVKTILASALTIAISHISYRYMESYFLTFKKRFSPVELKPDN